MLFNKDFYLQEISIVSDNGLVYFSDAYMCGLTPVC